ncbi:MAG: DUF3341 domain-containing protein [Chloroflexaceae bacterium]|jgi:hypothetical protein|nr:DUF3341 domain-containing protein [Chloroflexaceae bacterium]
MRNEIHGVMAEFAGPEELIEAAHKAREAGYKKLEAYSPFPVEEVIEEIVPHGKGVQLTALIAGLTGALSGFILQYVGSFVDYRINVGGRPLGDFSALWQVGGWEGIKAAFDGWAAFIPITFEMGILFAAFGATLSMLVLNGFPQPYHPAFNAPRFERASQDAFFLCIEANDPLFDRGSARAFLQSLNPVQVSDVAN